MTAARVKEWLKHHWLYLLAGLVVLYLLVTWLRNQAAANAATAAASGTTTTTTGTTTTGTTTVDPTLAAQQEQDQTQLALAKLQAGTQLALASLGAGVQTTQSAAQTQAAQATLSAQLAQAQLAAQTQQQHDLYSLLGNTVPQLIGAFVPQSAPSYNYGSGAGTPDTVEIGSPAPLLTPDYSGQNILAS
jgi:hypothetical protein